MKIIKQNGKMLFLTLLVIILLTIISLYHPIKLAYTSANAIPYIDFSYMTVGTEAEHVSTTVYVNSLYTIANGYIGGETAWRIGDTTKNNTQLSAEHGGVTLVRSDITVTYGSTSGTSDVSPSTVAVTPIEGGEGGYGTFVASKQGSYTITYSYEYTIDDKTYYNYYDMTVTSSLSEINVNLEDNTDNYPPQFRSIDINNETLQEVYEQYADIELPTIIVTDDLVNYMNYKINVYHISKDGARTKISSPLNSSSSFSVSDFSYTVYGGTFTAPFAGDYSVATEIRDSANNTIVVFSHYSVAKKMIVQEPVVNSTLESQTVELDDNPVIEIPVPTVEYSIDNSLDYESYFAGNYDTEPDYVVLGVDADGNATDYIVSNNLQNSYIPTREDVGRMIDIYYNVTLRVYAPSEFTYHEGTYEEFLNDNEFGTNYFTLRDGDSTVKIKTVDENSYNIKYANNNVYQVTRDEDGVVTVALRTGTDETPYNTIDTDIGITDLFANLITFNLTSDIYYITVQDTIGPVIRNYNYVNAISADQLSGEGYTLNIQGIEATDASGINLDRSSVSVTTTYKSEGQTHTSYDSLEADELLYGKEKTITRSGTITISYTVYDNNGNSTTKDYVIKAGDVVLPTLTFDADFLKDSYKYDEALVINPTTIHFSDDSTPSENIKLNISLVKDSVEDTEIAYTMVDGSYLFPKFTEIGTYTLTISVTDSVGNFTTRTFIINVEKANYDMSNITFEDVEFVYDGTEKAILISGELPEDVTVSYSQNKLTNAGEIIVIATFSGDYSNHNAIEPMTAKLTIKKAIPQCTLAPIIYIRTGQRLSDITLPDGWAWEDDSQIFNTAGDFKAIAIYTPDDTDNYEIVKFDVTISVEDYIPIYIISGIIGGIIGIAIVGITGLVLYLIRKRKRWKKEPNIMRKFSNPGSFLCYFYEIFG